MANSKLIQYSRKRNNSSLTNLRQSLALNERKILQDITNMKPVVHKKIDLSIESGKVDTDFEEATVGMKIKKNWGTEKEKVVSSIVDELETSIIDIWSPSKMMEKSSFWPAIRKNTEFQNNQDDLNINVIEKHLDDIEFYVEPEIAAMLWVKKEEIALKKTRLPDHFS